MPKYKIGDKVNLNGSIATITDTGVVSTTTVGVKSTKPLSQCYQVTDGAGKVTYHLESSVASMSKYKVGDKVVASGIHVTVMGVGAGVGSTGKYYQVKDDAGHISYHLESKLSLSSIKPSPSMTPPKSVTPPKSGFQTVKFNGLPIGGVSSASRRFHKDRNCPICKEEWKVTPHPFRGASEMWYDCIKCNKTREQVEASMNEEF